MGRALVICLTTALVMSACDDDTLVVIGAPDAPEGVSAGYYAGAVTVSWGLAPSWDGEAFRIYSRRDTDAQWFWIAEVTSCSGGLCTYDDINILENQTYEYYVASVATDGSAETASSAVVVDVPSFTPPPIPDGPFVIALDNANYISWGDGSESVSDFSFYQVYLDDGSTTFLLGDTDSRGFLDQRALNGETYSYYVTALDQYGHESEGSALASGTPRPDYHGEWIYSLGSQPNFAGFRFQADEMDDPILSGTDPLRDFHMEFSADQWFLVPGPNAGVYPTSYATSALKCGVGADFNCTDVSVAPSTNPNNYLASAIQLFPQTTYVLCVDEDGGSFSCSNYGVIRVEFLGFDDADPIAIFDWAFQLQTNNPNLAPSTD